jgi:uncharacterized protein (DUF2235 family)
MELNMLNSPHTDARVEGNPRQLILCCDGTNNTLTGNVHDTNVLKLIGQLANNDDRQILYYDPGVGSPDQFPPLGMINDLNRHRERVAGMARGKGIYENIGEAYQFLIDHYQPGDHIYLFGFSRGAFTARCVAGMVNLFGIVRTECKSLILTLIRIYFSTPSGSVAHVTNPWARNMAQRAADRLRENADAARDTGIDADPAPEDVLRYLARRKARRVTREEAADQVRSAFTSPHGREAFVHFVGVWDTVESVGIPLLSKRTITSDGATADKRGLRHIRHAVSMDEHRMSFEPRLYWDEEYTKPDAQEPSNARSLRQRWFRGVHSDVGGGYDTNEAGLSDQAYRWMLGEAVGCGLRTGDRALPAEHKPAIAHDPCHDTPWWGVAGMTVRTNITHKEEGRPRRVSVIAEGAAADANARIYPAWSGRSLFRAPKFWIALACAAFFGVLSTWLGAQALEAMPADELEAEGWYRVLGLDYWQRIYAWNGWEAPAADPVFQAILADFAFIAAYSWLLGLFASWAFREMGSRRNPQDKVPPIFFLGMAPFCAVAADVAENFFTMLTLWAISLHVNWMSEMFGGMMMTANLLKWTGLGGSALLLACGLYARARHPRRQPPSMRRAVVTVWWRRLTGALRPRH